MTAPARRRRFTFREYLELEEASNTKHEYAGVEIYAMAGRSPEHAALSMALGAHLLSQVGDRPYRVYSSDLRVRVLETGLATYPDVTVVCGPPSRDPESDSTVVDPVLVAEVLSPSTQDYDRGERLEANQRIPSLRAVLLPSTDTRSVERGERGWSRRRASPGEHLELSEPELRVEVDALYALAGL
jgi:Uma2 family endonuclease